LKKLYLHLRNSSMKELYKRHKYNDILNQEAVSCNTTFTGYVAIYIRHMPVEHRIPPIKRVYSKKSKPVSIDYNIFVIPHVVSGFLIRRTSGHIMFPGTGLGYTSIWHELFYIGLS